MTMELERQRRAVLLAVIEGRTRAHQIASKVLEQAPPTISVYREVDRALQWLRKKGVITFGAKEGWKPVKGKEFPRD